LSAAEHQTPFDGGLEFAFGEQVFDERAGVLHDGWCFSGRKVGESLIKSHLFFAVIHPMTNSPAIIQRSYDLLLYLVPQLAKFPQTHKFALADRIQNTLTDIFKTLIRAGRTNRLLSRRRPIFTLTTTAWAAYRQPHEPSLGQLLPQSS